MCKILLKSALACWERWDRPVLRGAGGVELVLRPRKQHPVPLQHPVCRRCSQGRDGGAGRAARGRGSGAALLAPSSGQIPVVRGTLQEASSGPSLGNILSHHFCKTRSQTASFSVTAPGPSASSSRTRRGLLGKSSRASLRPVKPEGFLFLFPTVWFLPRGCTSRRDHLPPARSKRSDGQGSVAERLALAQGILAKIHIHSSRRSPPGLGWDSGAGREGHIHTWPHENSSIPQRSHPHREETSKFPSFVYENNKA